MTQKERVLQHLQCFGEITSWDAWEMYHITRLSEIIRRLRFDGYSITTKIIHKKKGESTQHYAKYSLQNEGFRKGKVPNMGRNNEKC